MKINILVLLLCSSLLSIAQPVNDDPCGAITLPVLNTGTAACNQVNVSMAGATFAAFPGNTPFCGNGTADLPDVWYSFTMPQGGKIIIHSSEAGGSPDSDAGMQLYSAPGCSGTFVEVACNDDGGPGNMPLISYTGIAGNIYYIRLVQYNGATNGLYNICLTDPNPPLATSNIGIGITGPDSTLDVNGNMKVRGGTGLNNVTISNTLTIKSGSPGANKILTSDASGNASWQNPPVVPTAQSQHPAVIAVFETGNVPNEIDLSNGTLKRLRFRLEQVDNGNMYNDSVFTAPTAGVYSISLQLESFASGLTASPTANALELQLEPLQPGGYYYARDYFPNATSGYASISFNKLYSLNAGDRIQFNIQRIGSGGTVKITSSVRNFISIHKVY